MIKEKTLVFSWLCFCHMVGVFGVELKSVSVMKGESVTLQSGVTELQTDDEIEWRFGTNGPLIAKIIGKTSKTLDGPDGRFRDRLELDKKTGSLTITNTTNTTDSGLYEVTISTSRSETKHRFTVTVTAATSPDPHSTSQSTSRPTSGSPSRPSSGSPSRPSSGSPSRPSSVSDSDFLVVLISAVAAGSLVIVAAVVGIFWICRKQRKTNQQVETRDEEITYADPVFYKRNVQKSEDEVIYAGVVTRR